MPLGSTDTREIEGMVVAISRASAPVAAKGSKSTSQDDGLWRFAPHIRTISCKLGLLLVAFRDKTKKGKISKNEVDDHEARI